MKSILSRKFSRSLSSLVSPSRSHQDNTLSLPDYYRDTRREIYGPYWSASDDAYCTMRTMDLPYGYGDESCRSSFLLDIGYPGDQEEERKPGCCLGGFPFAVRSGSGRQASSAASKSVSAFHRTALKGFLSLFCGLNHAKNEPVRQEK